MDNLASYVNIPPSLTLQCTSKMYSLHQMKIRQIEFNLVHFLSMERVYLGILSWDLPHGMDSRLQIWSMSHR